MTKETSKKPAVKAVKVKAMFKPEQLFKTTAEIEKAVKVAVKSGETLGKAYQRIACSAIVHLSQHKDIRIVRNILETMPPVLRKQAMAAFFDRYASVRVDAEGVFHYDAKKKAKLGEALEKPWQSTIRDQEYRPFVFEQAVMELIKKAETRLDKGLHPEKGDKVTIAQVDALKSLVGVTTPLKAVETTPATKAKRAKAA